MADFQNQSETPYYELLTPGKTETQENSTPYQSSNEVNQQTYNCESNIIYRAPYDFDNCLIFYYCYLIAFIFSIIMISTVILGNNDNFILPSVILLILFIIACIVGYINIFYVVINISSTLGTIAITKRKFFFCFTKKEIIQINDVQQVIVDTKNNLFNVIFKLSNGREVYGCSKIYDKNGKGKKAFEIIRNALPKRISFSGNLVN